MRMGELLKKRWKRWDLKLIVELIHAIMQTWSTLNSYSDQMFKIISLSASANKLSKIQDNSDEYAALIMEELDPGNAGYIEVR